MLRQLYCALKSPLNRAACTYHTVLKENTTEPKALQRNTFLLASRRKYPPIQFVIALNYSTLKALISGTHGARAKVPAIGNLFLYVLKEESGSCFCGVDCCSTVIILLHETSNRKGDTGVLMCVVDPMMSAESRPSAPVPSGLLLF